jgi:hypothetical protein
MDTPMKQWSTVDYERPIAGACWIVSNILRFYIHSSDHYWYVLFISLMFGLVVNAFE